MFLSLFLLLLAFFILLNSLATLMETRSRAVLSSVAATFKTEDISEISAEILVSTLGTTPDPAEVVDEVERLWVTAVPVTKVETVTAGDDMILELPITRLFVGAEARVRDDRADLVQATASALSARLEGVVVIASAIFFVENLTDDFATPAMKRNALSSDPVEEAAEALVDLDDPGASFLPANAMDGMPLAMARADAFAAALIDAGAPPDGLQMGLREGNPAILQMRFFLRDLDSARLTFAEPVEALNPAPAGPADAGVGAAVE